MTSVNPTNYVELVNESFYDGERNVTLGLLEELEWEAQFIIESMINNHIVTEADNAKVRVKAASESTKGMGVFKSILTAIKNLIAKFTTAIKNIVAGLSKFKESYLTDVDKLSFANMKFTMYPYWNGDDKETVNIVTGCRGVCENVLRNIKSNNYEQYAGKSVKDLLDGMENSKTKAIIVAGVAPQEVARVVFSVGPVKNSKVAKLLNVADGGNAKVAKAASAIQSISEGSASGKYNITPVTIETESVIKTTVLQQMVPFINQYKELSEKITAQMDLIKNVIEEADKLEAERIKEEASNESFAEFSGDMILDASNLVFCDNFSAVFEEGAGTLPAAPSGGNAGSSGGTQSSSEKQVGAGGVQAETTNQDGGADGQPDKKTDSKKEAISLLSAMCKTAVSVCATAATVLEQKLSAYQKVITYAHKVNGKATEVDTSGPTQKEASGKTSTKRQSRREKKDAKAANIKK